MSVCRRGLQAPAGRMSQRGAPRAFSAREDAAEIGSWAASSRRGPECEFLLPLPLPGCFLNGWSMEQSQRDEKSRGGFQSLEFATLLLQSQVIPTAWLVEDSGERWPGDGFS